MDKMKLYNAMPIFVQNIGCRREGGRLAELRFGGDFKSRLADYNSRIACSRDELLDIRDRKLRKMVQFCYDEVLSRPLTISPLFQFLTSRPFGTMLSC